MRLAHGEPVTKGLQAPLEHELRLAFLARDQADHVLVEAGRDGVRLDIGDEAVSVLLTDEGFECGIGLRIGWP